MVMPCLRIRGRLASLVDGSLDRANREEFAAHIRDCGACRAEYESLRSLRAELSSLPSPGSSLPPSFADSVMRSVRGISSAADAGSPSIMRGRRRLSGRAIAWAATTAAAAALLLTAAWWLSARGAVPSALLVRNGGATLIAHGSSERIASPGDRLCAGDTVLSLPGDHARIELEGGLSVDLAPASAARLEPSAEAAGGAITLLLGAAKISSSGSASRPWRVLAGDLEVRSTTGAEGIVRVTYFSSLDSSDDRARKTPVALALDGATSQQLAPSRIEISTISGSLHVSRRAGAPAESDAASPLRGQVIDLLAGRSLSWRGDHSAPESIVLANAPPSLDENGIASEEPAGLAHALRGARSPAGVRRGLETALLAGPVADAAEALTLLGSVESVPLIESAFQRGPDPVDEDVYFACLDALARLKPGNRLVLNAMARAARSFHRGKDPAGASSLTPSSDLKSPRWALAAVESALSDDDEVGRSAAVIAAFDAERLGEARRAFGQRLTSAGIRAVGVLRDASFVPFLTSIALDATAERTLRQDALCALGQLGSRAGTPALVHILSDENVSEIRAWAAFALTGYADPAAIPELVRSLQSGQTVQEKNNAAIALRSFPGEPQSGEALRAAASAASTTPGTIIEQVLLSLQIRREQESIPVIRELLADARGPIRAAAVRAALVLPDRSYLPLLSSIERDAEEDPMLRSEALEALGALGAIGGPVAEEAVLAALDDKEPLVGDAAVSALNYLWSPTVESALLSRAEAADPMRTPSILSALGSHATKTAQPENLVRVISTHLSSPQPDMRRAAVSALGFCRTQGAAEAVQPLLKDADPGVAEAAAKALVRLGSPEGWSAIDRALTDSPSDRPALMVALATIDETVEPGSPFAPAALEAARRLLATESGDALFLAVRIVDLLTLDPADRERALEPLVSDSDPDPWVRWAALVGISRGRSVDPRLIKLVTGPDIPERLEYRLGLPAEAATPDAIFRASDQTLKTRHLSEPERKQAGKAPSKYRPVFAGLPAAEFETLRDLLESLRRRIDRLSAVLIDRLEMSPSAGGRLQAAEWLGELPSPKAARALLGALRDTAPVVRDASRAALVRFADGRSDVSTLREPTDARSLAAWDLAIESLDWARDAHDLGAIQALQRLSIRIDSAEASR
jgi:HEAT repeat protein